MAGDGDGKSALGEGLTADMVKNRSVCLCFGIFDNDFWIFDFFFFFEVEKEVVEIFDADYLYPGD